MSHLIGWLVVAFGIFMGTLCLYHGFRKILKGETSFRGMWLLKNFNECKGTLADYSGTEILAVGIVLFFASGLVVYYLI
jgi:hypothetical protein